MGAVARFAAVAILAAAAIAIVAVIWLILNRSQPVVPPPPAGEGGLRAPIPLEAFKVGIGCVESDGNYEARNARTGAIGKYQVLPRNWRDWAERFLDDPDAEPTPENQETVATKRFGELRRAFDGNYARVAYWWLTGGEDPDKSTWSDFATNYVNSTIAWARASQTKETRGFVPISCFSTPTDPYPAAAPTFVERSFPPAPSPSPKHPTPPPKDSRD